MRGMDDSAAYAVNWRVVLAVDAGLGVVVVVAGGAASVFWNAAVGALLIVLGGAYVVFVGLRARRWSRLRRAGPGSK